MILADTSVWIEYFRKKEPCHTGLANLLEDNSILAMEVIFGELLQGAKDKEEAGIINEFWHFLPKAPEGGLFLKAGWESSKHKLVTRGIGLIDVAVVVMARSTESRIWTLDKKLLSILSREEIYQPA